MVGDHGPEYLETGQHVGSFIREPWNTASCLIFLAIAAYWVIRLRGRYREHSFLTACLPVLAVGTVGGTVYHAFRAHRVWLFMDWMPIAILCIAASVYLWSKLTRRWWWALAAVVAVVAFRVVMFHSQPQQHPYPESHPASRHGMAILAGYATMGALIALPGVLVLYRTRFRHGIWPLLGLVFFAVAMTARTADGWWPEAFPMGTHWLWHVFGAAAGQMVAEYVYRLPPGVPAASQ